MDKNDIITIIQILKKKGREDLANLLVGSLGEIDESSTYGSYLFSTISQYLFYLPLENFHKIKNIPDTDKKILLESVLYLYPHHDEAPEIRSVDFRVLRNESHENELISCETESQIKHDFVKEQFKKCVEKLEKEDFDGAISSAGSLLEGVFQDIHKRCTGKEMGKIADLRAGYKKLKSLLKLSEEQHSNENAIIIARGLTNIVSGIDGLRNQMGDRHFRMSKPWKRHAKFCVNSVNVITDFLYETLFSQEQKIEKLYKELIDLLDGEKRFLGKDDLLKDEKILKHLEQYDFFLKNKIKNLLIEQYEVNNYRQSDIYFSALSIFFEELTESDMDIIFNKNRINSQACGLKSFLNLLREEKPEIANNKDMIKYLDIGKPKKKAISIEDIPF